MFKNLTVFKLHDDARAAAQRLMDDALLTENALRPCGTLETQTVGFVPVLDVEDPPYHLLVDGCLLVSVAREYREVPAGPLNTELKKRIKAWEAEHQSIAGSRVRRELKAALVDTMLAQAFTQTTATRGYIDLRRGWVVIDTANTKAAELFLVQVRKTLGSFAVTPLASLAKIAPALAMTRWLSTGKLPRQFTLGQACELKGQDKSTARFSHANLDCQEIRDLITNGMLVTRLEVQVGELLAMTLTQELVLRKFELSDVTDQPAEDGTQLGNLAASLTLLHGTVGALLNRLVDIFDIGEEPGAQQPSRDERQMGLGLSFVPAGNPEPAAESHQDTNVVPLHPSPRPAEGQLATGTE